LNGTNLYPGFKSLFIFLKNTHKYCLNTNRSIPAETLDGYLEEHGDSIELPDPAVLLKRCEKYGLDIILPPTMEFVRLYLEKYRQKVVLIRNNADRKRFLELLAQKQVHQVVY
jgi:hypothetical protein